MLFDFDGSKTTVVEMKGKGPELISKYLIVRVSTMPIPLEAGEPQTRETFSYCCLTLPSDAMIIGQSKPRSASCGFSPRKYQMAT